MANKYELVSADTSDKKVTVLTLELQESDAFNRMLPKQVEISVKPSILKELLGAEESKAAPAKASAAKEDTGSKKK